MNKVADKEEYLLVLDENGNSTEKLELRSVVHNELLWHNEIALWILNKKDKTILLQRRSPNKRNNPNKLAICAGHVTDFNSIEETVKQEAQEELGINISKYTLNKIRVVRCTKPTNHCFSHHYYIVADIPVSDFKIQTEELSEVLYMPLHELKQLTFSNSEDVVFKNTKTNQEIFTLFDEIFNN